MKQKDHLKITEEVVKRIAPSKQGYLKLLIAASGEHPDLEREGRCGHHSTQNLKQVESRIWRARQEFLQQPFSREFQVSLGIALHYIQDLFTIAVPDRSIQGTSLKELHNDIEAKFPIYTRSVPYEVLGPELLEGADEVLSFVRESIEPVVSSPQYVLSDPEKALDRCFETCLSVAKAVCENEKGFSKGSEAIEVSDGIEQLTKRVRERLDAMLEAVNETVRQTQKYLLTPEVKQEAYQWRRRAFVHKEEYPDAPLKSHLRTLSDIGEWERDLSENVSRLNEIIESGYEQDYKTRQDNLGWYGLKRTEFKRDFKTVQELNELVQRANEALSQAEEKRTGLESRIQGEMARIDTMLLEKQIENLLDCGRMGIKGHYYEEARKCFKQVLELDISNQEAIDGLARIDEIFSRRAIEPVEPIEAEIRTKLPLAKEISLRVNSAFEWIRKALEKYESRESARQEKRRIVEERKRVWYGEMVCGRCGYGWQSRRRAPPAQCPSCGSRTISPVLTQQSKRQPEWSKLAILVGGLLMLLCLCNGFASLISPTPEATQTPAPTNTSSLLPTRTLRPTPTLRPPTSTPRPPTPTPMPTNTPKPLATPTSSLRVPLI